MSDLRVALVCEGPTDEIVIHSALQSILGARPFVLTRLFPATSEVFGEMGTGWAGVYRWCHQSAQRGGGSLENDPLVFLSHDLLILHLDADVAAFDYRDGSIEPHPGDAPLPCEAPCPPSRDTADRVRALLTSWCRMSKVPSRIVMCVPSKSTEAWVVAALFPGDRAVKRGIECLPDPESRLGQQPKTRRIRKNKRDYQERGPGFRDAWPRLSAKGGLGEARRFSTEVMGALREPIT